MPIAVFVRALIALLFLVTPAWAATVTIEGTVTYRERIALPPDAILNVALVRLTDGKEVVGASAAVAAQGRVPIAFALNVHVDVEMFDGSHGLKATISSGNQVLFLTPVPVPLPEEPGTPLSVLVNHMPQPVAEPEPGPSEPDILELEWTVTSIGGRPVVGTRALTLSIASDHRAGGSGGCNNFFTEASIDADRIAFGPAAATRMACEATIMDQETAYFAALAAVASYELDAQGLRLLDASGIPLIGLVRATE